MDDDGNINMVEEPSPEYTYTYADYLKWQFEERLELFKGKIFKMSAPNTKHQVIAGNLHFGLRSLTDNQKCNVFIAPFDVRLPVCIVCDETKIDERGCCGAPDLVIGILSPGTSQKEVRLKFQLYEEAGVKEYWIVNPVEENLVVHVLEENQKYKGCKMYAGGDVIQSSSISGLSIDATDIFKK